MTPINKQVLLMALILCASLIACKNNSAETKEVADMALAETNKFTPAGAYNKTYDGAAADSSGPAPAGFNEEQPKQQATPASATHIDWDKKIIRNASLTIEAKSHKSFNDFIHQQVKRTGGYVAEEEQNKSDYKIENIATIKVPVDQFDELVKLITTTKDDNVVTQKVTSQDVTGDVIDTRSRTEAKRQVRLRYLDLLKQAKNMEEILKVQGEINNIQEEIEAGTGRVSYLTHAAAYSTIQLTFYEILNPIAEHGDNPGFGQRVLNALRHGMDWVGQLLVVVLTLWPLWLLLGGAWWGFRRWKAKNRAVGLSK
jgi:hypothetical protein